MINEEIEKLRKQDEYFDGLKKKKLKKSILKNQLFILIVLYLDYLEEKKKVRS